MAQKFQAFLGSGLFFRIPGFQCWVEGLGSGCARNVFMFRLCLQQRACRDLPCAAGT